ncbi:MAG: helix-turn-helix domain-containing protein [Candidatus Paceibacterota bacterium]|jgi:hypothetical protein
MEQEVENNNNLLIGADILKTRTEYLPELSLRTKNALINAHIRTLRGILRAGASLLELDGLGIKGYEEIQNTLALLRQIDSDTMVNTPEGGKSVIANPVGGRVITDNEREVLMKTRIEDIPDLSTRTRNALLSSHIRTLGGLYKKFFREQLSLVENIDGLGIKGYEEIEKILINLGTLEVVHQNGDTPIIEQPLNEEIKIKSINDAIFAVSEAFGITEEILVSSSRKKEIVEARNTLVYCLREYAGMSFPSIGKLIGGRDHTTVIHSYVQAKKNLNNNYDIKQKLKEFFAGVKMENTITPPFILSEVNTLSTQQKATNIKYLFGHTSKPRYYKEISDRAYNVHNLWKEGLSLEEISKTINVTRERVRQILLGKFRQEATNAYIKNGIIIDPNVAFEEESKQRKKLLNSKKPAKPIKETRWCKYYIACRSCGTTSIPHVKKGLCEHCVGHYREDRREDILERGGGVCESCGMTRSTAISVYGRDFYITKDRKVFCRECFLSHSGKALGSYKHHEWSRNYPCCTSCGTTTIPYSNGGLCKECTTTLSKEERENIIKKHGDKCDRCGIEKTEAINTLNRDFYITTKGEVFCRSCFQQYAIHKKQ